MKRYPAAVDAAIAALLGDRLPPAEILERLNAGTAAEGLAAVEPPMPRRTFFDHLRRVRAANPDLEHDLTPENELDRAAALRRRLLHLCEQEYETLAAVPAGRRDTVTLARLSKTVDDIHARARRRDQLAQGPNSAGRASAAAAGGPRESVLASLERAERRGRAAA